jgi:hypothetical protein
MGAFGAEKAVITVRLKSGEGEGKGGERGCCPDW